VARGRELARLGPEHRRFDLAAALRGCETCSSAMAPAMAAGHHDSSGPAGRFRQRLNELARARSTRDLQPRAPRRRIGLDESHAALAELDQLRPTAWAIQRAILRPAISRTSTRSSASRREQHVKLWVTTANVAHEAVCGTPARNPARRKFDLAFARRSTTTRPPHRAVEFLDWRSARTHSCTAISCHFCSSATVQCNRAVRHTGKFLPCRSIANPGVPAWCLNSA